VNTRENRLYARYEPRQPVYVYLGSSDSGSVGRVTAISQGGLGFDYVEWQGGRDVSLSSERQGVMDLVVKGEGPRITQIPFELVYERPAAEPFFYWATRYRVMSCGLKFGNLSQEQKKALNDLLESVTEDSAV